MKYFFLVIFIMLMGLSVIAWRLDPSHRNRPDGRTVITWATHDNPARREQIHLFNQHQDQISLRLDPVVLSLEKVIVQCLAGAGPDLIDAKSEKNDLAAYVKAGIAWDITDELKARGIDVRSEIWPAIIPDMIYEDRVYAVGANAAVAAIWYNKKMFQQCGIDHPPNPKSWEEIIRLGQRLTLRDGHGRVRQFGLAFDWTFDWPAFLAIHGARVFNEDGTRCVIDSPEAIQAVQFMHDLVYRYEITPTPAQEARLALEGGWGGGQVSQLSGGKAAMAMGGRYWLCALRRYEDLELGVIGIPGIRASHLRGFGRATVVNRCSPRRQMALHFLLFQFSQKYNEMINHQADGMGPVMRFSHTDRFLNDPLYPRETDNAVWRESMERALPYETSLYANGLVVERVIRRQMELVRNNQRAPAEAMRMAARLINENIARNLEEDPSLREKWGHAHATTP